MVLVFNLDEESCDGASANSAIVGKQQPLFGSATLSTWMRQSVLDCKNETQNREFQNVGSFSAALACYPIISQIAQDLDLNSLDNLARTCHLFHALLTSHRKSLIAVALRCHNDKRGRRHGSDVEISIQKPNESAGIPPKRWPCATDLVGECRRCGTMVCRNCTAKTLSPAKVAKRHRRLCNICARAPLLTLIAPYTDVGHTSFTSQAFVTDPCDCPMFFWLCQPCGQYLPVHDSNYHQTWTWRIRYSTYLGGLGTGIGEGYEGVKCGRGEDCLAARKIEVEEDCASDSTIGTPREGISRPSSQHSTSNTADHDPDKAGYFRQEVEGIGGFLRSKVKRMVIVGQTVQEHEDERETGDYLSREAAGLSRSWCSWCERIILSAKDKKQVIWA